MPAKTVRFAEIDDTYSPPATPSPTFSSLTLSTSGPITPPPAIPLQHLSSASIHELSIGGVDPVDGIIIHETLAMTTVPKINFDLSNPPCDPILSSRVLNEAATLPPTSRFIIVCEYLPWEIRINPTSTKSGAFVTVADVLNGLYSTFRLPVREIEYRTESLVNQARINDAFIHRCSRPEALSIGEGNSGVRRIDFMVGNHRFLGFQLVGPLVWRLCVSS